MKKIVLWVIVLVVALSAVAIYAFVIPGRTAVEESFSLRGRYTWGMELAEVMALAEEEGLGDGFQTTLSDIAVLLYRNASVGNHIADEFAFHFPENKLQSCTYYFLPGSSTSTEVDAWAGDLLQSLTDIYGEPSAPTHESLFAIACWPLDDVFIELVSTGSFHYIRYSSPAFVDYQSSPASVSTPPSTPALKNDGF